MHRSLAGSEHSSWESASIPFRSFAAPEFRLVGAVDMLGALDIRRHLTLVDYRVPVALARTDAAVRRDGVAAFLNFFRVVSGHRPEDAGKE